MTRASTGWHDDWKRAWECEHPRRELRVLVKANGARTYYRQCLDCGAYGDANVRTSSLTDQQKERAPYIDRDLQHDYWRRESADYDARMKAERERDRAEWWRWYNAYLQSPEWRELRSRVMRRANGTCEGCGIDAATQVHHLTYERVGEEMLFDLVAVCDNCHHRIHEGDR